MRIRQWFQLMLPCFRVFLASQFQTLLPHLEGLIPETKRSFLTQFFSHVRHTHVLLTLKYRVRWNVREDFILRNHENAGSQEIFAVLIFTNALHASFSDQLQIKVCSFYFRECRLTRKIHDPPQKIQCIRYCLRSLTLWNMYTKSCLICEPFDWTMSMSSLANWTVGHLTPVGW